MDLLAGMPVGGDLQDDGAGEAAVGEQHRLFKAGTILGGHRHRQADARQIGERLFLRLMEGKGHQPSAGRQHLEAELLRQLEAIRGRPQLGHGETAGRHHQRVTADLTLAGGQQKALVLLADGEDLGLELQGHPGPVTLGEQHIDDILGALETEQLPQGALVIVDPVAVHQIDKVLLGVAGQRRLAEVGILRQVGVSASLMVGEVAATAATDEDLAARFLGIVEHQHGAAPIARLRRTHQSGRTGPDHHHIDLLHHHSLIKIETAPGQNRDYLWRNRTIVAAHQNKQRPLKGPLLYWLNTKCPRLSCVAVHDAGRGALGQFGQLLVNEVEAFAIFTHQTETVDDALEQLLLFMLLGHIPLQEVEGGVVLSGEGHVSQTIDALGDVVLVLQGGTEHVAQRLELVGRGINGTQLGHGASLAHIGEQTLHMLALLNRVLTQEGRRPFKALVFAPGAHLQIEIGGVELQVNLLVQLLDHGLGQHLVSPQ